MDKANGKASLTASISRQEELKGKLNSLLPLLLKAKGVEEVIAAVESGDGSFQWFGSIKSEQGFAADLSAQTPFWTASITKLFIASAVLKLQEQNLVAIEKPLKEYIAREMIDGLHRDRKGVDKTDQITVRNLLSHTSGLPDYIEVKPEGGKSIFEAVLEEGDRSWSIGDSIQIVKDAKSPLFDPQPENRENKRARYSDTNFQLLIALLEEVSGKTVYELFREMFYKPLNLTRTFHPGEIPLDRDAPEPLPVRGGDQVLDLPLATRSFGDLYSTTADLFIFMRALIRGTVFENPETAELMRSSWNRFGFMISPIAPGWPIEYGLGMMRFELPRFVSPFKAVPAVIGHTGSLGTWLFYCPANDFYLAGSANQIEGAAAPFRFIPKAVNLIETYRKQ